MTSAADSFPERLTKIDEITRAEHSYLLADDECFFLGEYTARRGFSYSATNNLISNFKKSPLVRHTAQWEYKRRAMNDAARALFKSIGGSDLSEFTFVPVPPSKAKNHPEYDDRISVMLGRMNILCLKNKQHELNIRELVLQPQSTDAAHQSLIRPRPEELANLYQVQPQLVEGCAERVLIVDDMLTTGCHYRAMVSVLQAALPGRSFFGLFLARRVPEAVEFDTIAWE